MALKNFAEMRGRLAGGTKKKMAVAGADDEHSVEAAVLAHKQGLAEPVLVGDGTKIREFLKKLGEQPSKYEIVEAAANKETAEATVVLAREKKVNCILKGGLQTGDLIRAVVNSSTGIKTQELLSHVTILEIPAYHKLLAVTDGAIVPAPDLNQKLMILDNALRVMHGLGYAEPKVGALESNEVVNPKIPSSAEAAAIKEMNRKGEIKDCLIEGPISLDLAVDPKACREKRYQSPVAGDVDLLLCPFITVANAMVKGIQTFGGGTKTAGVVVGASVPIILISRAASAEEKVNSISLAALVS
ncbi:MAG: phosphate butyryltransferase [Candidatus Adiutrix sp.]|jgi:phosphate butyryltransferase|nr:phosphate butyryltransferase [Candidatus Adiutrix sp.]